MGPCIERDKTILDERILVSMNVNMWLEHEKKSSTLINILKSSFDNVLQKKYRPLTQDEIAKLQDNGNTCTDWADIKVHSHFTPHNIYQNQFVGKCFIGIIEKKIDNTMESNKLKSHISRSIISNTFIGDHCIIDNVGLLTNAIVSSGSSLFHVQSVSGSSDSLFGNGSTIKIGNETGGREINLWASMPYSVISRYAVQRDQPEIISALDSFILERLPEIKSHYTVIGPQSHISFSRKIANIFCTGAIIEYADEISDSTLLGSGDDPIRIGTGTIIRSSALQWGAHVDSQALISSSIMCEHSSAERKGIITHSVIGPNSGAAEGEITSSLIGPFVGFHHQSLLISALWPLGRGNIGYGANIGSNHTGKAPDQEIHIGEGVFFGLSTIAKFPINFLEAPYTIIATGVSLPPQKMSLPFSLINLPSGKNENNSENSNEIFPAWVLSQNLYSVMRNEKKYLSRNKARRSQFDFRIFRPEIINQLITARESLKDFPKDKNFLTGKDIPSLGKNYAHRRSIRSAINTYTFFLQHFALHGLFRVLEHVTEIAFHDISDSEWEMQKKLLRDENLIKKDISSLLDEFLHMEKRICESIENAKSRDDGRGMIIQEQYAHVHVMAHNDPLIKDSINRYHHFGKRKMSLLNKMPQFIDIINDTLSF